MKKELAKFEYWKFKKPNISSIVAQSEKKTEAFKAASTPAEALKAYKAMSKLMDKVHDDM